MAAKPPPPSVSFARSLSGRLLMMTLCIVMVSEVLIYVPSIAQFRLTYLEERVATAQLASLAATVGEDAPTAEVQQHILDRAEIKAIVLKRPDARTLILGQAMPPPVEVAATFDLRDAATWPSIREAFAAMTSPGRTIRVVGPAMEDPGTLVDIVIDEAPLRNEMFAFSVRVLGFSLIISAVTGALVFLALHLMIVRPLRRLAQRMLEFRKDPEGAATGETGPRDDEIGVAQRELSAMQDDLRLALKQKTRLAELGAAVSKINHDLRNILATAQLVSDRLTESGDPEVRRTTPVLLRAIDRAVELCTQTLQFGKAREQPPQRTAFPLRQLVADVGTALGFGERDGLSWRNEVPETLAIAADREQLFRVFMNLGRNALEALDGTKGGAISVAAAALPSSVVIDISDNGPGVSPEARANLFRPFKGSTKSAGSGLGLAIARDLVEGHGGSLDLHHSDRRGTTFRIELPTNIRDVTFEVARTAATR